MVAMAAAPTDITTVDGGEVVLARRRGRSKAPNFSYRGPVSVIRLELDVSDPVVCRRVQAQWSAVFRLRRALQRDAAHRCRAYWAAHRERGADPKGLRERLGLSRKGIAAAAKSHIEASGWMRTHLTKAIGLHGADEVWETVDRHLFTDSAGRRHGAPRVGSWWDFTRIPGRARSHTKTRPTWETWRLVGTLDGHLGAYRHPRLPVAVRTATEAAGCPAGTSILAQPARLPAPGKASSGSWWDHTGALAVVFTGLPAGDIVLPVRLPQGAGQWAHLTHFLADPAVWHKIDLVRLRDRKAPGGWRYYAHLLVHQSGYQSAATQTRRTAIPTGRRAGVDANVSNLTLASFSEDRPDTPLISQICCAPQQLTAAARAAKQARDRQRALDRSRRNTNPEHYGPSPRQAARADRRACAGLPARQLTQPGGPRHARADGVPLRAYRHDRLSRSYGRIRSDHATQTRAASAAKHSRARDIAAQIVALHGNTITAEDCRVNTWATLWGKRIAIFSPGMLMDALKKECAATGGALTRAATRTTAMSQHCLCGQRVPKTLAQRIHDCPCCGLQADRDVVSAVLAAASGSPIPTIRAQRGSTTDLPVPCGRGWPPSKSGRAQSTGTSHQHHHTVLARSGPAATTRWPLLSKQHSTYPRTDQTPRPGRHGTSRKQPALKLIGAA